MIFCPNCGKKMKVVETYPINSLGDIDRVNPAEILRRRLCEQCRESRWFKENVAFFDKPAPEKLKKRRGRPRKIVPKKPVL